MLGREAGGRSPELLSKHWFRGPGRCRRAPGNPDSTAAQIVVRRHPLLGTFFRASCCAMHAMAGGQLHGQNP
jgi:hypothetical protein